MNSRGHKRNRWGSKTDASKATAGGSTNDIVKSGAAASVSDEQALNALLSSAASSTAASNAVNKRHQNDKRYDNSGKNYQKNDPLDFQEYGKNNRNSDQQQRERRGENNHYQSKRQRRRQQKEDEKTDSSFQWGGDSSKKVDADGQEQNDEEEKPVEKPNFGLSGALAQDEQTGNVYNGVLLKFTEPPEARTPNTRWRLYVFKKKNPQSNTDGKGGGDDNGDLLDVLHISKQSAYLFGRERKVADIPVDHPSLSKQHSVLQYRALPDKNSRELKVRCKPYLMDLGSTNGTFINGVRLEDARYYELRKGDVITLGASTREYVLLTENTTST